MLLAETTKTNLNLVVLANYKEYQCFILGTQLKKGD